MYWFLESGMIHALMAARSCKIRKEDAYVAKIHQYLILQGRFLHYLKRLILIRFLVLILTNGEYTIQQCFGYLLL